MLRTDSQQVPIASVLDVDVKQSMSQKARGVGNVIVHIQRATKVEKVTMEDIPNFREGQRIINETSHAARLAVEARANTVRYQGTHPAAAPQPVAEPPRTSEPAVADPMQQLKQLGELRGAGILSDEEFVAKKAEILARM